MTVGFSVLSLLVAITCSLIAPPAHAEIISSVDYPFPLKNPYFATATAAADHAQNPVHLVKIEPRPDRANVPLMKGRNQLYLGLFKQDHPAPLVFVIPGLGGDGSSGTALMLAEEVYNLGYNVVTLPNPFSWQYILAVSETALPGYIPRDAVEYYDFLKFVTSQLQANNGVQVNGFGLLGFSLGGLLAAHLVAEDNAQKFFRFEKVLLINPAMDIQYGIRRLDSLYTVGDTLPQEQKDYDMGFLLTAGANLIKGPLTPQSIGGALQQLAFLKQTDIQWLIGESFRESVQGVVYSSQQVYDLGQLTQHADSNHQNLRLDEAKQVSLYDYMEDYVLPSLPKDRSVSALLAQSSMYPVKSIFEKNDHIYVMENVDDLIIKPTDLVFLKNSLKNRLFLYPFGGHLGNLWYSRNQTDLGKIFLPLN